MIKAVQIESSSAPTSEQISAGINSSCACECWLLVLRVWKPALYPQLYADLFKWQTEWDRYAALVASCRALLVSSYNDPSGYLAAKQALRACIHAPSATSASMFKEAAFVADAVKQLSLAVIHPAGIMSASAGISEELRTETIGFICTTVVDGFISKVAPLTGGFGAPILWWYQTLQQLSAESRLFSELRVADTNFHKANLLVDSFLEAQIEQHARLVAIETGYSPTGWRNI